MLRVLLISVPTGVVCLTIASLAAGGAPARPGLAWGGAAGLAGGIGWITFYRAPAQGPMSVVAPVSALTATVLPVAVGMFHGEHLVVRLVHRRSPARPDDRLVPEADARSLQAGEPSGTRHATGGLTTAEAPRSLAESPSHKVLEHPAGPARPGRSSLRIWGLSGPTLALAVVSGVLEGLANALYFIAAGRGLLSLVAVLASLYPAITVLLARLVYSERPRTVQRVGLAVAAAGVALVTAG